MIGTLIFAFYGIYERNILPKIRNFRGATRIAELLKRVIKFLILEEYETFYSIKLLGCKYYFSKKCDMDFNLFEEPLYAFKFLRSCKKKCGITYDVGSYHGFFAIIASGYGESYAFEMDNKNFEILSDNARRNNRIRESNKIHVHKKAIGESKGITEIKSGEEYLGQMDKQGDLEVEKIDLDSFSCSNPDPDIIKIDVEGAEIKVLEGAKKTIERSRPKIFLEVHPKKIEDLGDKEQVLYKKIDELGYSIEYMIEEENRKWLILANKNNLDKSN